MPDKGKGWGELARARKLRFRPEAVVGSFAPVPELVAEIEKLLEQAKLGNLRAAAWAVVYHADGKPDGEVASGWVRGPFTGFAVSAAIERLNFHWLKHQWGKP